MVQSHGAEKPNQHKVHALKVDTRDEESVQHMVTKTKTLFGRIDYFVSTAGLGGSGQKPISSISLEKYHDMDEVHNIGGYLCVRTILQTMLKQAPRQMPLAGRPHVSSPRSMSRGSVIILTSFASEGTYLGAGNYIAAKHAVKALVQTAGKCAHGFSRCSFSSEKMDSKAVENARQCIRVNAVAPAYVSGPMLNTFLDQAPAMKETVLGDLAYGRLVDPGEVADAVTFLVSASASYINGHTLTVDGGSSLQLANTPFGTDF